MRQNTSPCTARRSTSASSASSNPKRWKNRSRWSARRPEARISAGRGVAAAAAQHRFIDMRMVTGAEAGRSLLLVYKSLKYRYPLSGTLMGGRLPLAYGRSPAGRAFNRIWLGGGLRGAQPVPFLAARSAVARQQGARLRLHFGTPDRGGGFLDIECQQPVARRKWHLEAQRTMRGGESRRGLERCAQVDALTGREKFDGDDLERVAGHVEEPPRAVRRHADVIFLVCGSRDAVDARRVAQHAVFRDQCRRGHLRQHETGVDSAVRGEECR